MSQRKTDRVILTYKEARDINAIIRNALACVWTQDRMVAYKSFSRKLDKADIIHSKLSSKSVK